MLGKYASISINGNLNTADNTEFEAGKINGALTLGKDSILGITTMKDDANAWGEIQIGKISTKDSDIDKFNTATLEFGTGSLKLTGEINAGTNGNENKVYNEGFASGLTLADKSVLEFSAGVVNINGTLSVEAGKSATLKVGKAIANLDGGFDSTNYIKTIELNNGTLNIKQDSFVASALDIVHIQTNTNGIGSALNIKGAATITNSTFAVLPLVATGATSYKVLATTDGLTQRNNIGEFRVSKTLNNILDTYTNLTLDDEDASKIKNYDKAVAVKDYAVSATLKDDGKNLFLERTLNDLTDLASVKKGSIEADIEALKAMDKDGEIAEANALKSLIYHLNILKNEIENKSNTELATEMGGDNTDILLSAFGRSSGAINLATRNSVMLDIMETGGQGIVKDIKDSASSVSNLSSSTSSVMNTMNLSNDMAISGRIAQTRNPYANYASFDGLLYAALPSDMPLYYSNNGYMNGFWTNVVGGLNRIEGENGTLAGISAGFDKQLNDALLGFYISYANANLNDKTIEQSSQDIQVGFYASFNQRDVESNIKTYGQVAVTDTTAKRGDNTAEANFIRLYAGISANIGAIFEFNNNSTFIKPFIGENYYYAHTPAYKEDPQVAGALDIKATNNHALSFDLGVDIRQYWNENSFVYITPSVERYVINNGGDFTAGFIGSDTTFTIQGKSKTKTYIQTLLGGNISLGNHFNVNAGLGVKKILDGQVKNANGNKKDELYLSGNLGVKYRF